MVSYSELAAIRLGFGLSPKLASPASAEDLLASIANAGPDGDSVSTETAQQLRRSHSKLQKRAKAKAGGMAAGNDMAEGNDMAAGNDRAMSKAQMNRFRDEAVALARKADRVRLARATGDAGGFGERLVQFWSDHFTVQGGNPFDEVLAAAFLDEAIRPHLSGRFVDLLFAAETHPRMLTYLNQSGSFGPNSIAARKRANKELGLNENLAREMIELHSLGVGADYSQTDVRQLALLLTGLFYSPNTEDRFRRAMAEPGAETVLGKSYGGDQKASIDDVRAVIEDLAAHPATATHISRKLATHFISDEPPEELVARLAAAYRDGGGHLPDLYRVLAEAPELETHFRQKLRQPFDFVVAALRGLGMDQPAVMALPDQKVQIRLIRPLTAMGQKWGMPRGPDGWPEDASAWATPQGLAARIDWAMRALPALVGELPDPRRFLADSLGDTASEPLEWAVPKAESARDGVAVVLASSDFNRR